MVDKVSYLCVRFKQIQKEFQIFCCCQVTEIFLWLKPEAEQFVFEILRV